MSPVLQLVLSNVVIAFLLGLVVLAITRIWRNPHLAHALWLLVLLKLVTPPLVKIPVPIFEDNATADIIATVPTLPETAPLESLVMDADTIPGSAEIDESLPVPAETSSLADSDADAGPEGFPVVAFVVGIWGGGVVCYLLFALRSHRRLKALLDRSRCADPEIRAEAEALAASAGLRCPDVRISSDRVGPLVTAHWGKQTILLPRSLMNKLGAEERRTVIAHELAHVYRGDRWTRWFELLVLTLHWWNPVAWWARRRLHNAEEACCDAWVVWALPGNRRSYGSALLRTVEFLTEPPRVAMPLASHAGGGPPIKHRIEHIMKRNTHHRMTHAVRALAIALGLTILPFATTAVSQTDPDSPGVDQSLPESNAEAAIDSQSTPAAEEPGTTSAAGSAVEAVGESDSPSPVPDSAEWTVFEFSPRAQGPHSVQAAAVIRALAKTNPVATLPQLSSLAVRADAPLEKVHQYSAPDQIPDEKVRDAARALRPGQMSEVVQIDERAFLVRREGAAPRAISDRANTPTGGLGIPPAAAGPMPPEVALPPAQQMAIPLVAEDGLLHEELVALPPAQQRTIPPAAAGPVPDPAAEASDRFKPRAPGTLGAPRQNQVGPSIRLPDSPFRADAAGSGLGKSNATLGSGGGGTMKSGDPLGPSSGIGSLEVPRSSTGAAGLGSGAGHPFDGQTLGMGARFNPADPRYEARLRLLELDVKSAEIKRAAAAERFKNLERIHAAGESSVSQGELAEARFASELAEVEVERAKTAVKLFLAEAQAGPTPNIGR